MAWSIVVYAGVHRTSRTIVLFDDVRAGARCACATPASKLGVVSNFEAWLEQLLEELGVIGYFDVR